MLLYIFLTICLIVGFITIIVFIVKFLKFIIQRLIFFYNMRPIYVAKKRTKKHKTIKHKYSEYIEACWNEVK